MTDGLKGIEIRAAMGVEQDQEQVELFRWETPHRLRKHHRFYEDISLDPVRRRQWEYFWPRLRLTINRDRLPDVMTINGYGDWPLYASGKVAEAPMPPTLSPGVLYCPTCHAVLDWDEAFFGSSPRHFVPKGLLEYRTAVMTGRGRGKRERLVGVDALGHTYCYAFCPNKHSLPHGAGFFDRLIVGVLGSQHNVAGYADQWCKYLLGQREAAAFFSPAQGPWHAEDKPRIGEGIPLIIHPRRNPFPVSLWLHGLWDPLGQRSQSWSLVEHMDCLALLVGPEELSAGRHHGAAKPRPHATPAGQLLCKFWESAHATPGQKLLVSLAIVVTDCDHLIRHGALPAAMCWNSPTPARSHYNPLVQSDTSARLGKYVARHAPALYKFAQNSFSEVAFFGACQLSAGGNGVALHRSQDALEWMLARRNQIPVLKPSAALRQLSAQEGGSHVFT